MSDGVSMSGPEESRFQKHKNMIPTTNVFMAWWILICNFFWPGMGTCIMGCISNDFLVEHLVVALLQFVTAACCVGWIWSIYWGVVCLIKARVKLYGGQQNQTTNQGSEQNVSAAA
jgi:hypothetical protein